MEEARILSTIEATGLLPQVLKERIPAPWPSQTTGGSSGQAGRGRERREGGWQAGRGRERREGRWQAAANGTRARQLPFSITKGVPAPLGPPPL